jgi:uncharacterized OB-fold protein
VSAPLLVPVCRSCGQLAFPPHLICRRCGGLEWDAVEERGGVLEYATVVRRKLVVDRVVGDHCVGLVRSDHELPIVVRLRGSVTPGDRVSLSIDGGAVVAECAPSIGEAENTT